MAILYTPINVTLSANGTLNLDLNQDGFPDFIMGFNGAPKPYIKLTNSPLTSAFVLSESSQQGLPLTLSGVVIDSNYESAQSAGYFNKETIGTNNVTAGGWTAAGNNEGYAGLELVDGTGVHYAWAHFIYNATATPSNDKDTGTLTLLDAAMETTPGTAIQAGQTAEIGDIPTLAVAPVPQTGYLGGTVQLTATATAFPAASFQWQAGAVGSGIYTNLPGSGVTDGAMNTLTLRNLKMANMADYVLVVSNASGTATSSPVTVAVLPNSDSPATLLHRYSFQDTAGSPTFADSVGGPDWAGSLAGSAALTGASLHLDGTSGCYAVLPPYITAGYSQLTVEFWVDIAPGNPVWTRVFSFGDSMGNGAKNSGLDYSAYAAGNYQNLDLEDNANVDTFANYPTGLNGTTGNHITAIADSIAHALYFYNGTNLVSTLTGGVPSLAQINDFNNYLGKSPYSQDPYLSGTIHEFRIYSGVLPAQAVALNDAVGPANYFQLAGNPTVKAAVNGGQITLSWPVSDINFNIQARTNLAGGSWATLTNAPILSGTNWQINLPNPGAAQYFQLVHK